MATAVEIDTSDVTLFISRMGFEYNMSLLKFWEIVEAELKIIIVETIVELASLAGEGFPAAYLAHTLEVINSSPPIRNVAGGVEVDFSMLGTYEDYAQGFHRHAILADGGRVELPNIYSDAELKYPQETRVIFWEAMLDGLPIELPNWRGTINTAGLYDETILNRVAVWGDRAPEWWVLQNGSNDPPKVSPSPLSELVSAKAAVILGPLLNQLMQEAVYKADYGTPYTINAWHGDTVGLRSGLSTSQRTGKTYYDIRDKGGRFRTKG